MVCKILDRVSKVAHEFHAQLLRALYVLEGTVFRAPHLEPIGLRIACVMHQPVLPRVRTGKD